MENLAQTLLFALQKYPQLIELAAVDELVLDSARQNDRRPAFLKLAVPDDLVKALRRRREARDTVLLVRIPAEVEKRKDSRIVLPGEVG